MRLKGEKIKETEGKRRRKMKANKTENKRVW
jgi:hypothetical protein